MAHLIDLPLMKAPLNLIAIASLWRTHHCQDVDLRVHPMFQN